MWKKFLRMYGKPRNKVLKGDTQNGVFPFSICLKRKGAPMLYKFRYEGPVVSSFNTCICNHWVGETMAASEGKAQSNLMYQFKRKHGVLPSVRLTMPGKLTRLM